MKLYTEKQLRDAYIDGYYDCRVGEDSHHDSYQCPNSIELPSDEDIKTYVNSTPYYGHCTTEYCEGIEDGIKWVIDKIKGEK